MKKGRRRTTALLLAVCMVFSLISGVPVNVYAEEPENSETPTGLVVAGDLDWNDDVPMLKPDAEWAKDAGCDLYGSTWALKYGETQVKANEITVKQNVSSEAVSPNEVSYEIVTDCATQNKKNAALIDFTFPEVGDYVITYNSANAEENTITAHVGYPAIGIYTTSVLSKNLVKTDEVGYEEEQKQEIQKVQNAVDKIHEKKDKDFNKKYESKFIDLTVKTVVTPKGNGDKIEGKVTETKAPLIIKIPLPQELKGKGHYVILRYHDGKSDILTVKVEGDYLIFETDRFSTYAIVYREKEPIDDLNFTNVKWNSTTDTLTYDGSTKTCPAQLTGLPQGCTATLSGTSASAVGEYTAKIESITYTSAEGTATYKLSELTDKLPKTVVDGYNWAIEQQASAEKPEGGNGGGTGGGTGGGSGSTPEESKPEDTKPEDSKPEDTKPEDGKDSADTVTNPDGTVTKTEKQTVTNAKGKEVVVTTTTKLDANGAVISIVEKSVIAASSSTTSTTVTVKKDATGTIKSATASIAKTVKSGSKATIYASLIEQIVEAAGTDKVKVSMTVKDSEGKTKYTVKVYAENLKAGEKLYIYKYDTKNGYTMVDDKTYKVSKSGNVAVSISKKATYELVTKENASQIAKEIKATIKPKNASASVKTGKSANFTLSSKANKDNIKSVSYTTSKKSVATVNKSGKIIAKGKGTASIKAKVTLKNGETKTIKMTIKVK